jgi:hypothetical protein
MLMDHLTLSMGRSSPILKRFLTPQRRLTFQLRPSAQRIREIDGGLWPTPKASDGMRVRFKIESVRKTLKRRLTGEIGSPPFLEAFLDVTGNLVRRMDDGLSDIVDRLKGLGNSIVPQIAEMIFQQPIFDKWRE